MGSSTNELLIGFFIVAAIIIVLALIVKLSEPKYDDFVVKQKSGTKNYLISIYRFYQKVPILKVVFLKVKEAVSKTYPADSVSINKKVSEELLKITLIVGLGIGGSWLLAGDDTYFLLFGIVYTLLLAYAYISSMLKNMDMLILTQFDDFLGSIRNEYHKEPMIDEALYNTLDDVPYEIGLHVSKIHEIINSPRMEEKVDEYIGTEPNQFVLMFLSICNSIKEFSDKKLAQGTVFLKNVGYLKDEVHDEIDGKRQNELAFKGMGAIILVPALFCKPLQRYVTANFEGTAEYFTGAVNIVSMIAVFGVTFLSYIVLVNLRDGVHINEKNSDIFSKFAAMEPISEILSKIVNKHYTKFKKYNEMSHGLGDHTGMKAFLLKRAVFGIVAFAVSLFILITGVISSRYQALNNVSSAYEDSMTPSDEYLKAMQDVTVEYVHIYKKDKYLDDEEYKQKLRSQLVEDIEKNTEIKNDTFANEVADEIINRIIKYKGIYATWWEFLIALGLGVFGFYVPVIYLNFRNKIIEANKNSEIVRFQSIMLILMRMQGTTVDVILDKLNTFSYCFKDSISECKVNLSLGQQKAIQDMKDSESHKGFRDFCDCLLAIDRVGVEKAFDALESDRVNYLKDRKTKRDIDLDSKASKASLMFMAPFMTVLIAYLLIPIAKYALTLYLQTSNL